MSSLREFAQTIGSEAAEKLVADFAGTRLYIPHAPEPEDSLARSIGLAAAQRLARIYGGDRMDVPNPASRRAQIYDARDRPDDRGDRARPALHVAPRLPAAR